MLKNYEIKLSFIEKEIITLAQKIIQSNKLILIALEEKDNLKYIEAKELLKHFAKSTHAVDNDLVKILALFSPEAKDLRQVVSFLKVTNELNRAAIKTRKYIRSISQHSNDDFFNDIVLEYSIPMQKETISALEFAIAITKLDNTESIKVHLRSTELSENKTSQLYAMIEKSMFQVMCDTTNDTKEYLDVLTSFRGLDKIADRALSIAKLLLYAKVGGEIE